MIEPVYKTIGLNIRRLRKSAKLTQTEMAELLGFKLFTSISDMERGKIRIQVHLLIEIADLFGVSVQSLMEDTDI
jgi:transcriptional regulator with XRE-family HTH domain